MRSAAMLLVASGLASLLYAVAANPFEKSLESSYEDSEEDSSSEDRFHGGHNPGLDGDYFGSTYDKKFGELQETSRGRSHDSFESYKGSGGGGRIRESQESSEERSLHSSHLQRKGSRAKRIHAAFRGASIVNEEGRGKDGHVLYGGEKHSEARARAVGFQIDSGSNTKHVDHLGGNPKCGGKGRRGRVVNSREGQSEVKAVAFEIDAESNQQEHVKGTHVNGNGRGKGRKLVSSGKRHSEVKAFGFQMDAESKKEQGKLRL